MIAYLILAHKNPSELFSLLDALHDQLVYVHLDRRASNSEFETIYNLSNPKLHILNDSLRIKVHWGDISILKAIFNLFREATKNGDVGRVVLLTGQDYPILPLSRINRELNAEENRNFFTAIKLPEMYGAFPTGKIKYTGTNKIRFVFHQKFKPLRNENMQIVKKILSAIIKLLEILPIRNVKYQKLEYWEGSWTASFPISVVTEMLQEEQLFDSLRRAFAPEELFFGTFLVSNGMQFEKLNLCKNSASIYELAPLHIVKLRSKNNEISLREFLDMNYDGKFFVKRPDQDLRSHLRNRIQE